MILIILPFLFFIFYIIFASRRFGSLDLDDIFFGFLISFIGFLIGIIILLIAQAIPGPAHVSEIESKSIYSLQDNINSSDQFFLGSGNIDGDLYYYYIYETEDGGYKTDGLKSNMATIYYTDSDFRVDKVYYEYDNFIHRFLGAGKSCYKIYIPQGSILSNYNIDLQ